MYFVKLAWRKWQGVARIIGDFQSQVILSLFYIILLSIVGLIYRFFGDPLDIKNKKLNSKNKSNFKPWAHQEDTVVTSRKQF
jgi:hypothetical protein